MLLRKSNTLAIFLFAVGLCGCHRPICPKPSDLDITGLIAPYAETAEAIATPALITEFGEQVVKSQQPLRIGFDRDGNWIISGTIVYFGPGGVIHAKVNKRTGFVFDIYHSK